jgi:dipeptide/tripeptide permease
VNRRSTCKVVVVEGCIYRPGWLLDRVWGHRINLFAGGMVAVLGFVWVVVLRRRSTRSVVTLFWLRWHWQWLPMGNGGGIGSGYG